MINIYAKKTKETRTLILLGGESNSGGVALNSQASAGEIDSNSNLLIWDNINNDGFENLNIGAHNNLLGHRGLESYVNTCHGMELQLSNYADADHWGSDPIYLVKFGQGGTRVRMWVDGDPYIDIYPWTIAQTRINGALSALSAYNLDVKIIISLGINDNIDNNNDTLFIQKFQIFMNNIFTLIGRNVIVYGHSLMGTKHNSINTALIKIANGNKYFKLINGTDASLQDVNHFSYAGFKTLIDRMIVDGL